MTWYTYSLGGRFTIIVAEILFGGRQYQYQYAIATHEIPWRDLPYIIQNIQTKLNKGIYNGVA